MDNSSPPPPEAAQPSEAPPPPDAARAAEPVSGGDERPDIPMMEMKLSQDAGAARPGSPSPEGQRGGEER